MTFRFISDPGHGWLEVRGDQLEEVGAHPLAFSSYSYQTQGKTLTEAGWFKTYYLEEDCDASMFLQLYEAKHGRKPEIEHVYTEDGWVRNLPHMD